LALFWTRENAGKTLQQPFAGKNRRKSREKKAKVSKDIRMPKKSSGPHRWVGGELYAGSFGLARSLPLMIVDNSLNMHTTGFFPDGYLLSVTDGSIWIPHLDRFLEILMKPNFQVVKWESTFMWKMLSQAELETDGSCLATIFGSPPTPRLAVKCEATCRCCGRVVALFKRVNCRINFGREISSTCVPRDFAVLYMISGM